jgi:long-subunit fatty acid transport protein
MRSARSIGIGLDRRLALNEVAFGLGGLPTSSIDSSINANALGPGNPPIDLAGTSESEPGVCPVPTIGFVHRNPGSAWTLGVGIFGVGGFSANYPASTTNPISLPQPNGLGQLHAKVELYQVTPTISYALSDRLSFGVAPVLNLANFNGDPFLAPLMRTTRIRRLRHAPHSAAGFNSARITCRATSTSAA